MTKAAAMFSSRLGHVLKRYVDLKRALGRRFDDPVRTLQSLDRFLQDQAAKYPGLNAAAFQAWCQTQEHLASGVRRGRMREVYNFCLYRRRTEPRCFVPDPCAAQKFRLASKLTDTMGNRQATVYPLYIHCCLRGSPQS